MSNRIPEEPKVRAEEPELRDEALEQVAGGCQMGCSANSGIVTVGTAGTIGTYTPPTMDPTQTLSASRDV